MSALAPKAIQFDSLVDQILTVVWKILAPDEHSQLSRREWQFAFQDVYQMCSANSGEYIPKFHEMLGEAIRTHVSRLATKVSAVSRTELLQSYSATFDAFYTALHHTDMCCGYMYTAGVAAVPSTGCTDGACKKMMDVGLEYWYESILKQHQPSVVEELARQMERDRNGEVSHMNTVASVIESYNKLDAAQFAVKANIYSQLFEAHYVGQLRQYYTRESSEVLHGGTVADFLYRMTQRLADERLRSLKVLPKISHDVVEDALSATVVSAHSEAIESEFRRALESKTHRSLELGYGLMRRVSVASLKVILKDHVVAQGEQAIGMLDYGVPATVPVQYAECLVALHKEYRALIRDAFDDDLQFIDDALDGALRVVINRPPRPATGARSPAATKEGGSPSRAAKASASGDDLGGRVQQPADLLAKYCDLCLRKSNKHAGTDADIDCRMQGLMSVFMYLDDKDIFQKFYAKTLAKRLIHETSFSEEVEESMIRRLKQACGYEYTAKMHQMFNDVRLSAEMNKGFCETEMGGLAGRRLKLMVLQTGAWPLGSGTQSAVTFSPELTQSLKTFEVYYYAKHSGRKLNWLHHLSTSTLKYTSPSGTTYELAVTAYQMAVLMLFNEVDCLPVDSVGASTKLTKRELDRTVRSLLATKIVTLQPPPIGKEGELDSAAKVVLNPKFSNKKRRLRLVSAIPRDVQESKRTLDSVSEDRRHYLMAVVVRIMKSRKALTFTDLVKETISQSSSRFSPKVPTIKRCIEELIDKQYLERDAERRQDLRYLA